MKVSGNLVASVLSLVMYLLLTTVITAYFVVTGIRLVRALKHSPSQSESSKSSSNLMRVFMLKSS